MQSLDGDSGTVQGWEGGQLDLGCWEGNKEAHTIHFLKNCTLKTRTSSEIILNIQITSLLSTNSINSSMISFVHINFLLILLIFPFPPFYYHVLLFCKHHLIIPKQYSDWLISIKVHQSLKKNRMEFYSIKVGQSFWSKISLTVVTIKVSSKTLSKFSLTKKTLIVTTGLNNNMNSSIQSAERINKVI